MPTTDDTATTAAPTTTTDATTTAAAAADAPPSPVDGGAGADEPPVEDDAPEDIDVVTRTTDSASDSSPSSSSGAGNIFTQQSWEERFHHLSTAEEATLEFKDASSSEKEEGDSAAVAGLNQDPSSSSSDENKEDSAVVAGVNQDSVSDEEGSTPLVFQDPSSSLDEEGKDSVAAPGVSEDSFSDKEESTTLEFKDPASTEEEEEDFTAVAPGVSQDSFRDEEKSTALEVKKDPSSSSLDKEEEDSAAPEVSPQSSSDDSSEMKPVKVLLDDNDADIKSNHIKGTLVVDGSQSDDENKVLLDDDDADIKNNNIKGTLVVDGSESGDENSSNGRDDDMVNADLNVKESSNESLDDDDDDTEQKVAILVNVVAGAATYADAAMGQSPHDVASVDHDAGAGGEKCPPPTPPSPGSSTSMSTLDDSSSKPPSMLDTTLDSSFNEDDEEEDVLPDVESPRKKESAEDSATTVQARQWQLRRRLFVVAAVVACLILILTLSVVFGGRNKGQQAGQGSAGDDDDTGVVDPAPVDFVASQAPTDEPTPPPPPAMDPLPFPIRINVAVDDDDDGGDDNDTMVDDNGYSWRSESNFLWGNNSGQVHASSKLLCNSALNDVSPLRPQVWHDIYCTGRRGPVGFQIPVSPDSGRVVATLHFLTNGQSSVVTVIEGVERTHGADPDTEQDIPFTVVRTGLRAQDGFMSIRITDNAILAAIEIHETYENPATEPSYVPGNLVVEENGLLLSQGLTARIIATSGERVEYAHGAGESDRDFHVQPDAAECFPDPRPGNAGGWIYVSNSEAKPLNRDEGTDQTPGGVGAITFDATGNVLDYRMLLENTRQNCGGGPTPWGAWISGEEYSRGKIWQVDPTGLRPPQNTTMGETHSGYFESFAYYIRSRDAPEFFMTKDEDNGDVRRL